MSALRTLTRTAFTGATILLREKAAYRDFVLVAESSSWRGENFDAKDTRFRKSR